MANYSTEIFSCGRCRAGSEPARHRPIHAWVCSGFAAAHPKDSDPTSHIPAWVTSHGAAFHPQVHPIGRYAEPSTVAMLCSFADAYDGTLLLEGNKVSYTVFIKCALLYSSQWQMVSTEGLSER